MKNGSRDSIDYPGFPPIVYDDNGQVVQQNTGHLRLNTEIIRELLEKKDSGPRFATNRLVLSGNGEALLTLFNNLNGKNIDLTICEKSVRFKITGYTKLSNNLRQNRPRYYPFGASGLDYIELEDKHLPVLQAAKENWAFDVSTTATASEMRVFARELAKGTILSGTELMQGISVNYDHIFGQSVMPFLSPLEIKGARPEADFKAQSVWNHIGAANRENLLLQYPGDGKPVTVVIFDSAPADLNAVKRGQEDAKIIDAFIQMPEALVNLPATPDIQKMDFATLKSWSTVTEMAPDFTEKVSGIPAADLKPYHGLMAASLIRELVPDAKIILVETFNDSGNTPGSVLANAMDMILGLAVESPISNIDIDPSRLVFNFSFGIPRSLAEYVEARYLLEACQRACSMTLPNGKTAGAIIVAAAGNDSYYMHSMNPEEPAAYGYYNDDWNLYEKVIAVGASYRPTGEPILFSNQGNLAAPGDYMILDTGDSQFSYGRFIEWAGTSFATPLVSGIAAFLLRKGDRPGDIKQKLWNGWRTSSATQNTKWSAAQVVNLEASLP
jgi:hypothetical protein